MNATFGQVVGLEVLAVAFMQHPDEVTLAVGQCILNSPAALTRQAIAVLCGDPDALAGFVTGYGTFVLGGLLTSGSSLGRVPLQQSETALTILQRLTIAEGRTLTAAEREIAEVLVFEGRRVEALAENTRERTADFLVDRRRTELKTVSNLTGADPSKGLAGRMQDAAGQATDLILDARGQAGMSEDIAFRAIRRAYGTWGRRADQRVQSIRIIGTTFDITELRQS